MNPFLLPPGVSHTRRSRRPVVLAVTTALVLAGGGVGYAAWSATATGTSQAQAVTAVTANVQLQTGTADLYPGGSGRVHFQVNNPNPYNVQFRSAAFTGVASSDEQGCPGTHITVNNPTNLSITVPASSGYVVHSIAAAVTMSPDAPNACQGVTFVISTTLSGSSV